MLDQFVFGNDPVWISGKVQQKIKHLRLDMNATGGPAKLAPISIKHEIVE